jgi:hypothetical protein
MGYKALNSCGALACVAKAIERSAGKRYKELFIQYK